VFDRATNVDKGIGNSSKVSSLVRRTRQFEE
jgi:hypothetical protein